MVFVYVYGAWDMDGGWMSLPTRPQRYCNPASLVTTSDGKTSSREGEETEKPKSMKPNISGTNANQNDEKKNSKKIEPKK